MSNLNLPNIYAILDFQTCLERNLDPRVLVKNWCDAGIELIQIRAKNLSDLNYWVFAETVRDCLEGYEVRALVNRRIDIAIGLELDGVHLPISGLPIAAIKKSYPQLLVFASCHSMEEVRKVSGADAITLSPLFSPISKREDKRETLGLARYRKISEEFSGKTYALGGIQPDKLAELKDISLASLGFLCSKNAFENAKILLAKDNL